MGRTIKKPCPVSRASALTGRACIYFPLFLSLLPIFVLFKLRGFSLRRCEGSVLCLLLAPQILSQGRTGSHASREALQFPTPRLVAPPLAWLTGPAPRQRPLCFGPSAVPEIGSASTRGGGVHLSFDTTSRPIKCSHEHPAGPC